MPTYDTAAVPERTEQTKPSIYPPRRSQPSWTMDIAEELGNGRNVEVTEPDEDIDGIWTELVISIV